LFQKKKKVQHGVGYSFVRDDVVVGEGEGYSTCSSWGETICWSDAACRPAGNARWRESLRHELWNDHNFS